MKTILSIALLLMASVFHSQTKDIAGIYGEGLLNRLNPAASYIELKPDSTFIYNYYGKKYEGRWKLSENKVLLNPDLKKEFAKVKMKESRNNSDSITIKISYIPKKDDSGNTVSDGFKMATVYFDKKANYINILKSPYVKSSGRAPYIDRQNILNKENSVSVSKKDFSQLGFRTHNLSNYLIFNKANKDSNVFEFEIEDIAAYEDNIRDEFFILDGKSLYYPNKKGKIDVMQLPLMKKKM